MYCSYCGTRVANNGMMNDSQINGAEYNLTSTKQSVINQPIESKPLDILCLLGFIFSCLLMTLVGLILSIIGYNRVKNAGKSTSRTLAKAGIIISILTFVIVVILLIVYFAMIAYLSSRR